jgi:ubiquinone/menaquinone biosynthesis C-methylase UbiE
VLDVGCGTGEHALLAAAAGFAVTGVDAAPTAIGVAREKAAARSIAVRFEVADALDLPALGREFDTVLDCGLFHVFDDDDRARYVASLSGVVVRGGRYFVLCFSDKQPGDWGPRRVSQDELRESFAHGWRVDSIEDAVLETTLGPEGALAWLATFTRV